MIIGLTGGIGSGKSVATAQFAALGICVVDADIIARQVVAAGSPALAAISRHFGDDILVAADGGSGTTAQPGELNRKKLRHIIFSQPEEKAWLENLLHPLIAQAISERLQANKGKSPYQILASPLLFETQQASLTDRTLVIDCSEARQKQRVQQRDHIDQRQIEDIMATQLSRAQRKQRADDIISNNGSIEALQMAINEYHQRMLRQ